mgnify:CR=1 FL=1
MVFSSPDRSPVDGFRFLLYILKSEQMTNKSKRYDPYAGQQKYTTGFPSPATDYLQPTLDLNPLLVPDPPATVLVRLCGDCGKYRLKHGDILVVDRALHRGKLYLFESDGSRYVGTMRDRPTGECRILGVITWVIKKRP